MKNVKNKIVAASLLVLLVSPVLLAAEVEVQVDNIKEVKGNLIISIYDVASAFSANKDFLSRQKIQVTSQNLIIKFTDLPVGEYAIKCYQDVNGNGEMDTNVMGMPKEPYGATNNSSNFGAPSFSDAKFLLDTDLKREIHLK